MDYQTVFIFIILFFLSWFFSWTEIALMSLAKHKINSFVKQKLPWAKDLKYIKTNPDRLLITILIWNNLVNTYTAAFATTIAIDIAKNTWLGLNKSMAIWISTGVVTFLLLLFWEIAPKSFATKNSEKISLFVAKIYKTLMFLLFPLLIVIEYITLIFTGKKKNDIVSEEELEAFIDMWKETWTLESQEHEHLKNLLDFQDTSTEDIMTPRIKIDKLSSETTVKNARDYIISHTHSRIPVYDNDIDNIIGIINIRLLLEEIDKWNSNVRLKDISLITPIKVPLNKPIDLLLKKFQQSHQHISIVIDEYGWVSWVVTLEDVIEEVFWEIQDETDKEYIPIKKISSYEYVVDSSILFDEILNLFWFSYQDLDLDEKTYSQETISYFITHYLERFPVKREEIKLNIAWQGFLIVKIVGLSNFVIWNVKIKLEKK